LGRFGASAIQSIKLLWPEKKKKREFFNVGKNFTKLVETNLISFSASCNEINATNFNTYHSCSSCREVAVAADKGYVFGGATQNNLNW
jgi:mRNA degradation ribonuclease J1/J2